MFDLDGTLVASDKGITDSVAYSLKKMGIDPGERSDLLKFIGPPLFHSYSTLFGMSEEEADLAISYYREHYEVQGHLESPVYEGLEETLTTLKERGKTLLVVTSKPINMARKIIKNTGLEGYFSDIIGPLPEEKTIEKDEMIRRAFRRNGITNAREALMIGDRMFDIRAAKKNKVDCVAVLYGYGNREEFEREGAEFIVEAHSEIPGLV